MTPTGGCGTGAWGAELTDLLDLSSWPTGMRVIARKQPPGAKLRFTDLDGHRFTCTVTGTRPGGKYGQPAPTQVWSRDWPTRYASTP
jgi:hypothetical protein